jgi:hypothetical protein
MAPIKIYGVPLSPPFRTVVMTCKVLGLDYEIVPTNPLIGETQTEEFLKVRQTFWMIICCGVAIGGLMGHLHLLSPNC